MLRTKTFIALVSIFFLAGCFGGEEAEDIIAPTPTPVVVVEVEKLKKQTLQPELTLSGTIVAKEEITIGSEVTGTVSKIKKQEGDSVKENEIIIELDSGNNLIKVSYNSAIDAVTNAKKALSLNQQAGQSDIKNSQIAVSQAKNNLAASKIALEQAQVSVDSAKISLEQSRINYEKIKDTKDFTINSQSSQTGISTTAIEIAQKNLEIAEKSYTDSLANEEQAYSTLLENMSNTVSGALIPLRSDMVFIDELIGASNLRRQDNDSFETFLIGREQGTMQDTKDLWSQAYPRLQELEIRMKTLEKLGYTQENETEFLSFIDAVVTLSKSVRVIERNMETILSQSIASQTLAQTSIDSWKTRIQSGQTTIENTISSLTTTKQSLIDFKIQSPQRVSSAQLNVSVAQSQLLSQQQSLNASQSSEGSTLVSLDSDLANAKQAYQAQENAVKNSEIAYKTSENAVKNAEINYSSALNALETKKIQVQASDQSASAQVDSSQASLDQSALNLSKLMIMSGIKGTVTELKVADGDTISPGTPLAVVSDFSELKLITDVSLEESFQLKKGMTAVVTVEGIPEVISGKVSLVYPEADKITRRVRVEIAIPNTKKIPANVFATVNIALEKTKREIYIDTSTLVSQNPPSVMIVEKNRDDEKIGDWVLVKQEIELGEEKSGFILVSKGLRQNQLLVTKKYPALFDGDIVDYILPDGTTSAKIAETPIPESDMPENTEEEEKVSNPTPSKNTNTNTPTSEATPVLQDSTEESRRGDTDKTVVTPAPNPKINKSDKDQEMSTMEGQREQDSIDTTSNIDPV